MEKRYGVCSMVAPLRRVVVKQPSETEADAQAWADFGYHHRPDLARAAVEHARFVEMLSEAGAEVRLVADLQHERLDSMFVYDPLIMTGEGAIVCRMGKPLRRGEEPALAQTVLAEGIPILATIRGEGTLEGGDTFWLDDHTLVAARSYRSNPEGLRQLRRALDGIANLVTVTLPHWRGESEILHLLSIVSPVSERLAVAFLPLMPIDLVELMREREIELLPVSEDEFKTQASNILALAPNRVLMLKGNPATVSALRERGVEVWEYEGDEISFNRDGGPTCLTRPIWREYPAERATK